jgi:hypothetical protein
MDAKAREAEVPHLSRIDRVGAVIEQLGIEPHLAHGVADQFVDLDRLLEILSLVKERDLERQAFGPPEGTIRLEADVAKVVVIEAGQRLRGLKGFVARCAATFATSSKPKQDAIWGSASSAKTSIAANDRAQRLPLCCFPIALEPLAVMPVCPVTKGLSTLPMPAVRQQRVVNRQ